MFNDTGPKPPFRYFCPYELRRSTENAVGYDLYATGVAGVPFVEDRGRCRIGAGKRMRLSTGLHLAIEPGFGGLIGPRSGMMAREGILTHGVIDPDYRGEVQVVLFNLSGKHFTVEVGMKIAQLLIVPMVLMTEGLPSRWGSFHQTGTVFRVNSVEELGDTSRGAGGFGSTGR